jgi:hypothetical protein
VRACESRIGCQAATGSWTRFLRRETQRTSRSSDGQFDVYNPLNASSIEEPRVSKIDRETRRL